MKIGTLPEPSSDPTMTGAGDTWAPPLRLAVADTTSEIRKALKAERRAHRRDRDAAAAGRPGALAGLKVGDLITHLGTAPLLHASDILTVAKPTPKDPVLLRVVRGGSPVFVAVTGEDAPLRAPLREVPGDIL